MPTSSKTPTAETSPKSATRSGVAAGAALARSSPAFDATALDQVLDQLQDAVFTADLRGVITSCNRGVERYGYAQADLVGRNIADLCHVRHISQGPSLTDVIASLPEKARFEGELRFRTKAGEESDVHLCLTLLRDSKGAPAGILGFSIAMAAKKSAETQASLVPCAAALVPPAVREIDGTQFLIASQVMHKFMGMVDRVAGHTETVLVMGETGTGKELVARTIHESSYRHKNNLVDINCAALPEHLVESELFGYEKGAFSGADTSKPGLFELADKSTIFLDEIGELQPQIQVKLLRVLDGAPYFRLGGQQENYG